MSLNPFSLVLNEGSIFLVRMSFEQILYTIAKLAPDCRFNMIKTDQIISKHQHSIALNKIEYYLLYRDKNNDEYCHMEC